MTRALVLAALLLCAAAGVAMAGEPLSRQHDVFLAYALCIAHRGKAEWSGPCATVRDLFFADLAGMLTFRDKLPDPVAQDARDLDFVCGVAGMKEGGR